MSEVRVNRLTVEEAHAKREILRGQLQVWEALIDKWGTPETLEENIGMFDWLIEGHRKEGEQR
jgi:hypothetical protein